MIPVHNIYYMLSYAFQVLKEDDFKNITLEEFDNVTELYTAILIKGVQRLLKRGLGKEYISEKNTISGIKGRVDISDSIKTMSFLRQKMSCEYSVFSADTDKNRIIKATLIKLLHTDIQKCRKKEIRKILVFLEEVKEIDVHSIDWNQSYSKNDQVYKMLIYVCYMVLRGMIQTPFAGNIRIMQFIDEQRMCHLYEKFLLEYFRKEHPEINTNASYIQWQLDDGVDDLLPKMKTDITLIYDKKILIIDAKYYQQNLQQQFNKHTIISNNLYQIFAYVKNKQFELKNEAYEVAGMLLYAKTEDEIQPDQEYKMSGNRIMVKNLDLGVPFNEISVQLEKIAEWMKE